MSSSDFERIDAWMRQLDLCGPHDAGAKEVYSEAIAAGLDEELARALEDEAALCRTQATLLVAERQARWGASKSAPVDIKEA